MSLIARLSTESAIHELCLSDGVYIMRTYCASPESERELTTREAGEWIDTVRKCGGDVYARLGAKLQPSAQPTAATSERTS